MDPLQQLMMGAEQPYQQGDFQRSGPQMQPTGALESLMGAFSPRPWGVGDTINAALWAMPGMRGMAKRPSPVSAQQPNLGGDDILTVMRRDVINRGRAEAGRPTDSYPMDEPSLRGLPQSIATSRKAQAGELQNRWNKSGPDLDVADFTATPKGDALWAKEVRAYNKANGTTLDPDNMSLSSGPGQAFERYFNDKYLAGKKAKFPGVNQANELFADDYGNNQVHLKGKIPEEYR